MYIRRKITKPTLLLHNFKQLESDKNVWVKTSPKSPFTSFLYKYYWKERVLIIMTHENFWKITNELDAYKEILIS